MTAELSYLPQSLKEMISGTREDTDALFYYQEIYPYFEIVRNKNVLEVGPSHGFHTKLMESYNPTNITLIETDNIAYDKLSNIFTNFDVLNDDIMHYLEKPREFDVVVCCGVIYHLCSPLYLFELIANRVNPEYIILDHMTSGEDWPFHQCLLITEKDEHTPGNRNTLDNWKTTGLSHLIPQSAVELAMSNLGYELISEYDAHGKVSYIPKYASHLSVWKRI